MSSQKVFSPSMRTPWGAIQTFEYLTEGVVSVSTAGHGGLWLSDERMKQLPKRYKPFTKTRRWAEEDVDAALVLQHLGLLSLIPEPLELHVTESDIASGRASRRTAWYDVKQGGPIVESYKRQTGDDCGDMLCHKYLSPKPGGFKLGILPQEALDWMQRFDAGEAVEPITFTLEPYVIFEPVLYTIHTEDGKTHETSVDGKLSEQLLKGDEESLKLFKWLEVKDNVVKATYQNKVIWERE